MTAGTTVAAFTSVVNASVRQTRKTPKSRSLSKVCIVGTLYDFFE